MGELELIRWIRSRIPRRPGVVVVSGDDAAVLRIGRRDVLFKTDSVIDGVHFRGEAASPEAIGRKAVARCLSDIAAMGGVPTFAVASLMIPRRARGGYVRRIVLGAERIARRFGVAIVGGDVAVHGGPLAISVALLGEMRGLKPVRRGGARAGDAIFVTGPLGGSLLGRHLKFTPRVREGRALNRRFRLHAMIDISDGLAADLGHVCVESGVGAVLREDRVPVSAAARRLARSEGGSVLDRALSDGEDYELLFAVGRREAGAVTRSGLGREVGVFVKRPGLRLRRRDGSMREIAASGWVHRFGR